ncbi:MAG: RluA family pseudouridine synthase [Atopobiaceae bacterium]|nr:RluA family pseudouridine synthase [Atopobiaceae bacterium]MCH4180953.1 RluA family pseudouridine synthase [Atopobiaceae bacterium]MCH4214035.1 RluA family pseudouridine synthase [Atopobiaceae bacterium]MCH4276851.1 RluA family pseudouridine synthase [Atopobiaceae bacterium]MCI1227299.1 RluA family pseudouridine synthase [Atopobiaceae bacterium]
MTDRVVNRMAGMNADGVRVDSWLSGVEGLPSRSACAHLVEQGRVSLNGVVVTSKSERLRPGDQLQVMLPIEEEGPRGGLLPVPIPIDVRYEDAYLIVISKQAGLVCHPSPGHEADTLANALVARYGEEHLSHVQGEDRPGIVHRLDMDTSGLMVCAHDDATAKALQDLIRLRVLDRRYVVLVQGYVAPDEGQVVAPIARSSRDRLRMCVADGPSSREAITTFRTLERFEAGRRDEGYSLLECHLYTGRTHQIRVHMRHINHDVVGDQLYGHGDGRENLGLTRQFLHSWSIGFDHPVTGEPVKLTDSLPGDLSRALESLSGRSMGRTEAGERIAPALVAGEVSDPDSRQGA